VLIQSTGACDDDVIIFCWKPAWYAVDDSGGSGTALEDGAAGPCSDPRLGGGGPSPGCGGGGCGRPAGKTGYGSAPRPPG